MKGFIQIPLLIILLVGAGTGIYFIQQKTNLIPQTIENFQALTILLNQQTATTSAEHQPYTYESLQSTPRTTFSSNPVISAFELLLQRRTSQTPSVTTASPKNTTPSPTPRSTTTTTATTTPTPNPAASPKASPTPSSSSGTSNTTTSTCSINVQATPLDSNSFFDSPLTVELIYSAQYTGNKYVTGAQWDFNNDGVWDTDMSLANGTIAHTYPDNNSYVVRLKLQMSDGEITPVCSKTIIIPIGFAVKLNGQVYYDSNCNNIKDNNETGFPAMEMSIMNPNGLVYDTIASDNNGNYSFTKSLGPGQSLIIQPYPLDHNLVYPPATVTLNQSQPNATVNISTCPQQSNPTPAPSP